MLMGGEKSPPIILIGVFMIEYKHATGIRHGVILKQNGEPNVGIFHGGGLPSTIDDGGVPQGSLYIRSNGEIWQKTATANTSWVLNSAASAGGGGGAAVDVDYETLSARNPTSGLIETVYNSTDILVGRI